MFQVTSEDFDKCVIRRPSLFIILYRVGAGVVKVGVWVKFAKKFERLLFFRNGAAQVPTRPTGLVKERHVCESTVLEKIGDLW